MKFTSQHCQRILMIAAIPLLCHSPTQAQSDPEVIQRLERQLREFDATYRLAVPSDQPIAERMMLDVGGSMRIGLLGVDDENSHIRRLRQFDGILYVRGELDGTHRFFSRFRFLHNDFNEGDSFDGHYDRLEAPIADRYWYEFDSRGAELAKSGQYSDFNLNIKVGRQFLEWGSGLALSQVMYAGLVDLEIMDLGVTGLVSLTPSTGTIDFDGTRPGFHDDTDRAYYGVKLEYRGHPTHTPYVSFLAQRDHNDQDFSVFTTTLNSYPTRFAYDSEYWAIGSRGTLGPQISYRIELVHETGDALSNSYNPVTSTPIVQTTEDIQAWAGVASLSYFLLDDSNTRFDLEILGASGDDDRVAANDTFGGNTSGTRDFAFNSLGYVNTGLALAPEITNLISCRVGYSMSPQIVCLRRDAIRLGVNGFIFFKADKDAPMSFQSGTDRLIGGEIDLAMDWRISSDVNATVRYGLFLAGDAIPRENESISHYIYAGMTYAF